MVTQTVTKRMTVAASISFRSISSSKMKISAIKAYKMFTKLINPTKPEGLFWKATVCAKRERVSNEAPIESKAPSNMPIYRVASVDVRGFTTK